MRNKICDLCGQKRQTRRQILKYTEILGKVNSEQSEYDVCEKCLARIRGAKYEAEFSTIKKIREEASKPVTQPTATVINNYNADSITINNYKDCSCSTTDKDNNQEGSDDKNNQNPDNPPDNPGDTTDPTNPDNEPDLNSSLILHFPLDNSDTGLISSDVIAIPTGILKFVEDADKGLVLEFDGTGSEWIKVQKKDNSSVLTGLKTLTVMYQSSIHNTKDVSNWIFYAAPTEDTTVTLDKPYLGIYERENILYVVRKLNSSRVSSIETSELTPGWKTVSVVFDVDKINIYVDNKLEVSFHSIDSIIDILKENSILQIGKANLNNGEYCAGFLSNYRIYSRALSEEEINHIILSDYNSKDNSDEENKGSNDSNEVV